MTATTPPEVAVVMPAYNASATVASSIASVLAQRGIDLELLVVDDGSDDDTVTVVRELAASDPRLRVIEIEHSGVSAARNAGIDAAEAPVVAFLDADDTVDAEWLESIARPLLDDDAVGLVCCGVETTSGPGPPEVQFPEVLGGLFGDWRALFLAGTFAARRSLVVSAGGYDEALTFGENFDLGIRVTAELRSSRLQARIVDAPLLRRSFDATRSASRDRGRLISAERTLQKYRVELDQDRRSRSKYHRIAAVNAYRLQERSTSRSHARRALLASPSDPKAWSTAVLAHFPMPRHPWHRRQDRRVV